MRQAVAYAPGMFVRRRPHVWKSNREKRGQILSLTKRQATGRICTYAIVQWQEGSSTEVLVSRIEPIEN